MGKDGSAPVSTRYSAFVTRKRFSKYFRSILNHLGVENSKSELENFKSENVGHGSFKLLRASAEFAGTLFPQMLCSRQAFFAKC